MPDPINEVMKCQQALATETMSSDEIRALRPWGAQMPLFPPREGYGEPNGITLQDCFTAPRDDMARYDFSGSQGAYSATATPSMGVW